MHCLAWALLAIAALAFYFGAEALHFAHGSIVGWGQLAGAMLPIAILGMIWAREDR